MDVWLIVDLVKGGGGLAADVLISWACRLSCFVLAVPGMAYAGRSRLDPRRGHDQSGQVSSR